MSQHNYWIFQSIFFAVTGKIDDKSPRRPDHGTYPPAQEVARRQSLRGPTQGRRLLLVYHSIIDDERRENAFGLLMSLNMLIETPGGFDHTGAESLGWLLERLDGPTSMVVGVK